MYKIRCKLLQFEVFILTAQLPFALFMFRCPPSQSEKYMLAVSFQKKMHVCVFSFWFSRLFRVFNQLLDFIDE